MNPPRPPLGPTASLVVRAIDHGKERISALSLELAAVKGVRDRLQGENQRLIRELDFYKRAHRGDV